MWAAPFYGHVFRKIAPDTLTVVIGAPTYGPTVAWVEPAFLLAKIVINASLGGCRVLIPSFPEKPMDDTLKVELAKLIEKYGSTQLLSGIMQLEDNKLQCEIAKSTTTDQVAEGMARQKLLQDADGLLTHAKQLVGEAIDKLKVVQDAKQ